MLELLNDLEPFFKDNYKRIHVRAYAKLQNISPPTASKLLKHYLKEGLICKESQNKYDYYFANKQSKTFIDLSRIYWQIRFKKAGLLDYLEKKLTLPIVYLFGSFSKAEIHERSDLDIAIFTPTSEKLDLKPFEKKFKTSIQVFTFKDKKSVKNKNLLNNILNGYKLLGEW